MVACAANRNNSGSKKMKTLNEDATSAPDNPREEGIEMVQPHKGSTMSYGETSVTVSEGKISKKEITGTSHKAGNRVDLRTDMSSSWWTGMAGTGGVMPPLKKQTKVKKEPSEMTLEEEPPINKSTPWCIM